MHKIDQAKEAVSPIDVLQNYVRAAVQQETQLLGKILIEQSHALIDFLSRKMPQAVMLDSGALVGTLTPGIDARLSDRWRRNER